ncbi:MAG: GNAT family N-acetyltransferase [Anaerolineae bacterium]
MHAYAYRGSADLTRLQAYNAEQIAQCRSGWMEPGDIPHRIYNVCRRHDPARIVRLWEDDAGTLIGWAFAYPEDSFDLQATDETVLAEALAWVCSTLTGDVIKTDVWNRDDPRAGWLHAQGFEPVPDSHPYYLTIRDLRDPIPDPVVPEGFTIRAAEGVHEAGKLAEVHAGAFGSSWTPESYAKVMQSPGYAAEREIVVVSPDERFAAFTVTWHDERNKTGYFEPVGTHKDFQRLGLGRAMLYYAMQGMRAIGLEQAVVAHQSPDMNPGAAALYATVGFRMAYTTSQVQRKR